MPDIRLTLPDDLLERIDQARGDIPRTVWIRGACEQRLAPAGEIARLRAQVEDLGSLLNRAGAEVGDMYWEPDPNLRTAPDGSTALPGNTGVAGGTKHASPVPRRLIDHGFVGLPGAKRCNRCGFPRADHGRADA